MQQWNLLRGGPQVLGESSAEVLGNHGFMVIYGELLWIMVKYI